MSNQTDEQKQQIVMKFANEVQPKVFPLLAPTDHNVSYFQAIIEANWTAEFSVEYLANAIRYFRDKFQWLAEPSGKPVLSRAQRLAAVGLSENDLERRGERWDKKAERIKNEAEQARQED